ncbi:MAG TPA: DUF4331 family protein [Candidatus Eisenbacteria bacterium]|nr:DUF4331 family protein [Candidatus Eisenbacteria bacterium]
MKRLTSRAVVALALLMLATPLPALASSHSEAPGTTKDRLIDDTDLYAWVAKDAPNAVTFVGNWVPLIEPNSGPNFASFDDDATYYINVDNVGDAQKHIRFEFKFTTTRQTGATFLYNTGVVTSVNDPDLNVRQSYTLTRIDVSGGVETPTVLGSNLPVAPYFVGPVSMPDYQALAQSAIQNLPDGYKVFVGPRDDPFYVDLASLFDLLTIRRPPGNRGRGVDGVGGYNVMSIVLQVPKTRLTKDGAAPSAGANNHIIGIWDTAERLQNRTLNANGTVTHSGPEVQVSRLGMPLVNEIVIPLQDKDKFNGSEPANDLANFAGYVVDPEPARLLTLLYGISVPPTPRNDIVAVFATGVAGLNQPAGVTPGEMLRLNMAIAPATNPKRLGVLAGDLAGFPNGRRLGDDIVDIELRVVAGVLVPGFDNAPNNQLGDGIDSNDRPFLPYFPYVAPPQNPLRHSHHPQQNAGRSRVGENEGDDRNGDNDDKMSAEEAAKDEAVAPAVPGSDLRLRIMGANPGTGSRLEFALEAPSRVTLRIYDLQGRTVRTLVDQDAESGPFSAQWDGYSDNGDRMGRGIYFARLVAGTRTSEKKLVLE